MSRKISVRRHKRRTLSGDLTTVKKHTRRIESTPSILGSEQNPIIFKKICKSCGKTFETPYLYAGKCPECVLKGDDKSISDVQFKIDADKYVERYYEKFKLKRKPSVTLSDLEMHKLAIIRGGSHSSIRFNENLWLDYYEIDSEDTGKCLEFTIAHEMHHMNQREMYPSRARMGFRNPMEDDAADLHAQLKTGIKISDFDETIESLEMRRKMRLRGG